MFKKSLSLLLTILIVFTLCPFANAVSSNDCGAKLIAITFDDGPGQYTNTLLDGLAERGIKATFFVAGCNAEKYPETLKRIVSEGHQLGNHTYNHKNLNTQSTSVITSEMEKTQALITEAGGSEEAYIRPPYGNANDKVKSVSNVPLVYWSVDPNDWKYRNAKTVENTIVNNSYDGAIVLCHDIYYTTVKGALAAIDRLLDMGYEFVTVEDLLLRRGIEPEAGVMYYDAKNKGINLSADEIGSQYYDEANITTHWGYEYMKDCLDKHYMELDSEGRWRPNKYVTREEFVSILGKFNGIDESYTGTSGNVYSDVDPSSEYFPYIMWAYDNGLMIGDEGRFMPDKTLTREQMAVVVARLLKNYGSALVKSPQLSFADDRKISAWAIDSVYECVTLGILQGDGYKFMPKGKLTRAQIASVIYKLDNMKV